MASGMIVMDALPDRDNIRLLSVDTTNITSFTNNLEVVLFLNAYTANSYKGTTILQVKIVSSGAHATFIISNSGAYASVLMISFYGGGSNIKKFYRNVSSWKAYVFTGTEESI